MKSYLADGDLDLIVHVDDEFSVPGVFCCWKDFRFAIYDALFIRNEVL